MIKLAKVVTKTITAQDTFSDPIRPDAATPSANEFPLSVSIVGTFVATVFIQRTFDGGTTWLDVVSYTVPTQTTIKEVEGGVSYRIGVKTGGFTSGTIDVRLARQ